MFERLNTPEELYHFKLGAALKMEHTVLEMPDDNAKAAQDPEVEGLLALITHAAAMRKRDVVDLLKQNLEQEQHTLEEVKQATEKAAAASSGAPAS